MKNCFCPNSHLISRFCPPKLALLALFVFNILPDLVCHAQIVFNDEDPNYPEAQLEKIYIHTDKTSYNAGDIIWFKSYLIDAATLMPEATSKVVYAELINPLGELLITKTIKIVDGSGNGDFKLPINLTGGEYTLRAYTTYMRNFNNAFFFRKKININPVIQNLEALQDSNQILLPVQNKVTVLSPKPDIQFFPEGGYLVCGFPCNIGIKAVDPSGKGIDVWGVISDSQGTQISEFSTLKFGLGVVQLVPFPGETYKARISRNNTEYEYELPLALTNGAVMQVAEQKNFYRVTIHSSLPNRIKNFSFVGTQKNSVLFEPKIDSDDEGIILKVPKNMFEEGIAQFTLFDENDNPICERLVFVESSDDIFIPNISPSKKQYGKKELVELDISTDKFMLPLPDASMSISLASISEMTDYSETDIKPYLLLNAELRGEIEHPGYYFYSDDSLREKILDLLMMTQGWRRYIWNEPQIKDTAFVFQPETGLRFEGTITKFGNRNKSAKAVVSLTCNNQNEFSQYETDADENGHFKFDGIAFEDSTSVIIQAKRSKKEEKNSGMNYYIELDKLTPPKEPAWLYSKSSVSEITNHNYPKPSRTLKELDSLYSADKGDILIKEVIVPGKKPDRIAEKRTLYREPSYSLNIGESNSQYGFMNVLQIINNYFPGLEISGTNAYSRVRSETDPQKSGKNKYLYLLDGIPSDKETILSIPLSEIHFIDYLRKGAKTTIFGAPGAMGVIAVYTLDAEDMLNNIKPRERKGIMNYTHPGFSKAREFYTPVYSSEKSKQKPDYRTTLYWNPTLKLDEQDKAKISFYTSDVPSVYKVVLEGLSSEGDIIHSETSFTVY